MWQCPKCNRSFKNTDQSHFCGESTTIDAYIAEQPEAVQPILRQIRETIREAAPDSTEKISWQMPTFWQDENLIHFAAFKKHVSIFPGGEASSVFADKLTAYHTAKGTIQFPLDKPVPYDLIAEITRWRVAAATAKSAGKKKSREKGAESKEQRANSKVYEFEGVIQSADKGGAYVAFPYDVRAEFGKGRVKVHATFDGEPYDGSVVNMGVQNDDGSVCYIIGVLKSIRAKIGKQPGDRVAVTIQERGGQ